MPEVTWLLNQHGPARARTGLQQQADDLPVEAVFGQLRWVKTINPQNPLGLPGRAPASSSRLMTCQSRPYSASCAPASSASSSSSSSPLSPPPAPALSLPPAPCPETPLYCARRKDEKRARSTRSAFFNLLHALFLLLIS